MYIISYVLLLIALFQILVYIKGIYFEKAYKPTKKDRINTIGLSIFYIFAVVFVIIISTTDSL